MGTLGFLDGTFSLAEFWVGIPSEKPISAIKKAVVLLVDNNKK